MSGSIYVLATPLGATLHGNGIEDWWDGWPMGMSLLRFQMCVEVPYPIVGLSRMTFTPSWIPLPSTGHFARTMYHWFPVMEVYKPPSSEAVKQDKKGTACPPPLFRPRVPQRKKVWSDANVHVPLEQKGKRNRDGACLNKRAVGHAKRCRWHLFDHILGKYGCCQHNIFALTQILVGAQTNCIKKLK